MPHITIKMFPGREDAIKQKLSARLAEVTAETLQVNASYVSVSIESSEKVVSNIEKITTINKDLDFKSQEEIKPEYEE